MPYFRKDVCTTHRAWRIKFVISMYWRRKIYNFIKGECLKCYFSYFQPPYFFYHLNRTVFNLFMKLSALNKKVHICWKVPALSDNSENSEDLVNYYTLLCTMWILYLKSCKDPNISHRVLTTLHSQHPGNWGKNIRRSRKSGGQTVLNSHF